MFPSKTLKKHRRKLVILGLLALLVFVLGANIKWLWPKYWWGTSVVILMNENEARPCGGFVTAYGVVKLPFGGAEMKNSFGFPQHDLGENSEPLRQVSTQRKWWDLADSINPAQCATQFADAYRQVTGDEPNRVILLQSGVVEAWLKALGGVHIGGERLTQQNFFATTSRLVADIDRHDEASLAARKSPLAWMGKKLILTTLFEPWNWREVNRTFATAVKNKQWYWYWPGKTTEPLWEHQQDSLLAVTEWNLGGGKSSRYLDKQWTVQLRQRTPDLWDGEVTLDVTHLGDVDVPLSQAWKGGFELFLFGQPAVFVPAELSPGSTFSRNEKFTISSAALMSVRKSIGGNLASFWMLTPPSQNWHTKLQITALGQQEWFAHGSELNVKENTATWKGTLKPEGQYFALALKPDYLPPFLVWHKPLSALAVPAQTQLDLNHQGTDTIVEVQFNEPVKIVWSSIRGADGSQIITDTSNISLIDRDYEIKDYTENPTINRAVLLPDLRTLLLNTQQNQYQTNERFYLEITEVEDLWGNKAVIKERTVITR